jgi:hypothetical protein
MATRTLEQVLASLGSVYDPQVEQIRQKQALIPGQLAEEESGLKAKEADYFQNTILGGARRRGLGFSGIPEGERARYGATEFLPAIARLRQQGREQAMSLEDAILGIQERRNTFGNQIYQQDLDRDFAERQFQESQRQFNEQMAAQARERAAAAARPVFPSGGGGGGQNPAPTQAPDAATQKAYNDVKSLLSNDAARIQREYTAIKASAGYGNPYDKIKLQLIEQLYPAARSFGKNSVPVGRAAPTAVSLNPVYSGLSVGTANPGVRLR